MGVKRIGNDRYHKVEKNGRLVYVLKPQYKNKTSKKHSKYHITAHDRAVDADNGQKARGSHWGKDLDKIHDDIHKAEEHRDISEHDREVDRENGRDARGW